MNNFIEKIISLLSTISGLNAVYSPALKEKETKIAAIQLKPVDNNSVDMLSGNLGYYDVPFAILVKGNKNDNETVILADEIRTKLHNVCDEAFTNGVINYMEASNAFYAFTDDKENIVYNININAHVEIN